MSSYPGNSSLATAVKDRVLSTFEQAMALYRQGRTDEVVAGCNLILQMDPLFDPARKLLEKVRDPASPFDLGGASGGGDSMAEARQAMATRDFERVVQITTELLTNDLMNEEARVLSDEAREKMEASPFVDQFVRKCRQHIDSGNVPAARADLEKARGLDDKHPGIAQIEAMIAAAGSASPADAHSFVVETPAASPRGTAQASDFGFTFEEEKAQQPSGGFDSFSFDTPAPPQFSFDAPQPVKEGGEFDFSTASIETSPDDQKKIAQYLADGDDAFDGGDYQQAIDLWSRIFLIDVTHEAASERIEKAKHKRREIEQRLESIVAAGIQAFDKRDFATAKARFQEVQQGDPTHAQAREYLERIESEATGAPAFPPPPPPSFSEELDSAAADLDDSMFAPAEPVAAPAASRKTAQPRPAPAATKRSPALALAVIVAVILIGGAGWFFMSRSDGGSSQPAVNTPALVNRATSLGQEGRFDEAIGVLQEIKPGDAEYDTAIAMIADMQQKQGRALRTVAGRPAAVVYEESIAEGRTAFAARDFVMAKRAFEQAMQVKPLPPDLQGSYDAAVQQVAKLETARRLFTERKYADAIASLEPIRAREPTNASVRRMINDAYFNMGAIALQQDRIPEAIRAFDAVLKEDPQDELARRSRDLAQRYEGQPRDLLYRIYVKYLPLRQAGV